MPAPVLISTISIAQIFLSLQKPDPHVPECPIIKVSPTCGLDNVAAHHHLRQAIESILDVQSPLPTAKSIECNLPLVPEAMESFFGVLEKTLENFIDSLTENEQAVRHAEVEYLMMMRLALFVRSTIFMLDDGIPGDVTQRVTSLLDRLVTVIGGVSVLRYVEVYMGRAAERWYSEEGIKRTPIGQMWFYVWQLMKAAGPGLASALTQGRSDIFSYRGLDSLIPLGLKSVYQHVLARPAWWSAPGNGVPEAFIVGLKQFIPSTGIFDRLQTLEWSRLSFIDRVVVLMTVFSAAVQLSEEPTDSPRLKVPGEVNESLCERLETCCSFMTHIIRQSTGTEDGPKFARDVSEREEQREKQIQSWILVWESEKGRHLPFVPPAPRPLTDPPASADTPALEAPKATNPSMSQGSSIIPATPSVYPGEDDDVGATRDLLPIPEERDNGEDAPSVPAAGASNRLQESPGDDHEGLDVNIVPQIPAPRKKKVRVGAPPSPPPKIGVGENPLARLRKAVREKKAGAEGSEQPHTSANLQNQSAGSTPTTRSRQQQPGGGTNNAGPSQAKKPQAIKAKVNAVAKVNKPDASPRKLTAKEKRAETARKAAADKGKRVTRASRAAVVD